MPPEAALLNMCVEGGGEQWETSGDNGNISPIFGSGFKSQAYQIVYINFVWDFLR